MGKLADVIMKGVVIMKKIFLVLGIMSVFCLGNLALAANSLEKLEKSDTKIELAKVRFIHWRCSCGSNATATAGKFPPSGNCRNNNGGPHNWVRMD